MITPQARAVESRRYWDVDTEWLEIADQCIREKKFSVTTVCLTYSSKDKFYPTEIQWRNWIEDTVRKLLAKGANWNNSRIDIINEPTKHVRTNDVPDVENYLKLEHWAHNQIKGRLPMGSGCDELIYGGWQDAVASRGKAEWYVIHIQASCDSKSKTDNFVNIAHNRAVSARKKMTCNEGNYKNVSSSSGFALMKYQAEVAERHGCPEYLNVFNDLRRSAFPKDTGHWDFLCFKIDGHFRNSDAERHYNEWVGLMDSEAPIPNIEEIILEDDCMNLELLQKGSKNNQVQWLQEILEMEYEYPNSGGYDGIFGPLTESQVKEYQIDKGITVDGKVGKQTTFELINEAGQHYTKEHWKTKLQIYVSF